MISKCICFLPNAIEKPLVSCINGTWQNLDVFDIAGNYLCIRMGGLEKANASICKLHLRIVPQIKVVQWRIFFHAAQTRLKSYSWTLTRITILAYNNTLNLPRFFPAVLLNRMEILVNRLLLVNKTHR